MSTRTEPLKSATCLASSSRVLPIGEYAGMTIESYLHHGYASAGYKTDYQTVETCWFSFVIRTVGQRKGMYRCWKYSGKNLPKARRDYDKHLADIDNAIAGRPMDCETNTVSV